MPVGSIESYNSEREEWSSYTERFDQYALANGIEEEKKIVAVFLTVVGPETYSLLRDLLTPARPSDLKYKELVDVLKSHYSPKPLVIAERFHFHNLSQKEGESIADYVARLKKASERCQFKEFLEEALRDRFVCGLRSSEIQRKLLSEEELKFIKAVEIARACEAAEKQASTFTHGAAPSSHKINVIPRKEFGERGERKPAPKPCFRCGENHSPQTCRFKDQQCRNCSKTGHIAKVCRKSKKNSTESRKNGVHRVNVIPAKAKQEAEELALFNIKQMTTDDPIVVNLTINDVPISMELDTGASVSICSEEIWREKFSDVGLHPSDVKLNTYTGEKLNVLGQAQVRIKYEGQSAEVPVMVIAGGGPALFGRNWLNSIKLNWGSIKRVTRELDHILSDHKQVFEEGLGTLKGVKANLSVKADSNPKFFKPRPVPFALKDKIGEELDRLEGMGVLEKVEYSEWAAPIVPVKKPDGSIRLCGDYKVTINPVLEVDQHPLPNPEELFVTLSGGKKFSKLDLTQAYQQILLNEKSREFVTVNTHKGLYRPTRLPFGVASATAIFQSKIEQVLQGIPMVVCRVDDILVSGKSDEEHLRNLDEVLTRIANAGLKLKLSKCKFMQPQVEYLGFQLDSFGIHVIDKKVEAIRDAPAPEDQNQLRSFLGMVTYYSKFIPSYSTIISPLTALLHKEAKWKWEDEESAAFNELKSLLANAPVLIHFSNDMPVKLDTDASNYDIGAVISHILPDGQERPIAYASRTLNKSERNYPQIEKEALSIIFGLRSFISICTDVSLRW